jgi:2-amino-4-hydroxy-6-hydroxymethyldihydropteridine diphosphokinase
MAFVFTGLGSNIGERESYIDLAKKSIAVETGAQIIAESSLEETEPVDFTDQPLFLNQVIKIKVFLEPESLLTAFKEIEKSLGRQKRFSKGPREIDIDILLYDNLVYKSERLIIPHPEILNRSFVLKHLAELDPELEDPLTHIKYREVLCNGCNKKHQ